MKKLFCAVLFSIISFFSFEGKALCASHKTPIKVVASFSILADIVKNVGKEKVSVQSIVGPNGDAHVYEPRPNDIKLISQADIVFTNGMGFEGWINRLIEASGFKGPVVVATENIHPRLVFEGKLIEDPHAWHSISNIKIYIFNITKALKDSDPENATYYDKNAQDYMNKLNALDQEMRTAIDKILPPKRKVITAHDAFGYFGNTYGLQFLAPIGTNTESEPKVKDIIHLIEEIKKFGVKTIFIENITNPRVIQQIARETGAQIGKELYSDALSEEGGPADSYLKMMRHNFALFKAAMEEIS
jgi:zinc/manganese transport system substrate-binding protein